MLQMKLVHFTNVTNEVSYLFQKRPNAILSLEIELGLGETWSQVPISLGDLGSVTMSA